jgi:hypothetical protein
MVDVTAALASAPLSDVAKGKRKAVEDDASDEDDGDIFAQAQKQRFKDGAAVVKGMAHLRKKANAKGGGSFQSMGAVTFF